MAVSKIWVFAEASDDGHVSPTTLEMLTKARSLADTVEVVSKQGNDVAAAVGAHGATKVYNVSGIDNTLAGVPVAAAIAAAIEGGNGPDAIFLATSYDGRDAAGRLSVRLDAPVITNVVDLVERDGGLAGVEPVFGGTTNVDHEVHDRQGRHLPRPPEVVRGGGVGRRSRRGRGARPFPTPAPPARPT